MTYEQIKPYIEKKLVTEQVHPENPDVRIFNYSQVCQFEQAWDDITRQCRGLIMNVVTGEVIARPFPKFFNYGEHVNKGWAIPVSKPDIYEKLDGSLGILYWLNGKPWIATRGSFTSDQAIWATDWWRKNIGIWDRVTNMTHLFEIVAPWNRIVVNYDYEGLVYLATLNKDTGEAFPYTWPDAIRVAKKYDYQSVEELEKLDEPNSEGFVLFYPEENVRMKIKFPEYVRLHKLITGINEIAIWEHLRDGKSLKDLIEKVPDEFYQWVTITSNRLNMSFNEIADQAQKDFNEILPISMSPNPTVDTRKRFAILAMERKNPSLLFALYDNKPWNHIIWKMVRPHGAKVFKTDIDL